MYKTLALPALSYGCEPWAIREQDKPKITSRVMKFMSRKAKCTWHDYRTNEDILSELKINPILKKIQNYRNKWIRVQRMERHRLSH
jgi:tRNA(Ile2) C34 agmatinyltransferase TiaS